MNGRMDPRAGDREGRQNTRAGETRNSTRQLQVHGSDSTAPLVCAGWQSGCLPPCGSLVAFFSRANELEVKMVSVSEELQEKRIQAGTASDQGL